MNIDLRKVGLGHDCNVIGIDPIGDYNIEWIEARSLVSPERIDLIAKIKYVESYVKKYDTTYFKELYIRHIESCTNGTFCENGNENKRSIGDFIAVFNQLIEDIRTYGLDQRISVIPIDEAGEISNGAHRVAAAAYFGQQVPVVRLGHKHFPMDSRFFRNKCLPEDDIMYLETELCKWRSDIYVCCIWPSAGNSDTRNRAIDFLSRNAHIIDTKLLHISNNGLHNLIPQIYISKDWIGSVNNRFASAAPKIEACIGNKNDMLNVILFQYTNSLDKLRKIKEEMRAFFGIKENSLHMTDNPIETLDVLRMLFLPASYEALNDCQPFRYKGLNQRIFSFKNKIIDNNLDLDDFIIDSSSTLGLYGVREPDDLDFLMSASDLKIMTRIESDSIRNHENELIYHSLKKDDLIFDPANHFYYFGVKFITLKECLDFKRNRGEKKDETDIKLASNLVHNDGKLRTVMYRLSLYSHRKIKFLYIRILIFLKKYLPDNMVRVMREIYHRGSMR